MEKKQNKLLVVLLIVGIIIALTAAILHVLHLDDSELVRGIELGLGIAFVIAYVTSLIMRKKVKRE